MTISRVSIVALLGGAALALVDGACASPPPVAPPPAFEGSGRIAFVCVVRDTTNGRPLEILPREMCPAHVTPNVAAPVTPRLYGFVVERTRGELAAFDAEGGVVDVDRRVPGATFQRVGDGPIGVVVPNEGPARTRVFVASRGAREVSSYNAIGLLGGGDIAANRVALPASPTSLVVSPSGRALFATLPEMAAVARIAIDGGDLGAVTLINMGTTVDPVVHAAEQPWERVCAPPRAIVPPAPRARDRPAVSLGTTPSPVAMAVEPTLAPVGFGGAARLVVADAALPLLRVYEIGADDELTPVREIPIGAPALDVAVTPWVPAAGGGYAQYVYAIDASDGSIVVADFERTSPTYGAVISVDLEREYSGDRIRFPSNATSLAVITSTFDPVMPESGTCIRGNTTLAVSPLRFHGVFLAASLADGTVRIVDIFDLDAPCRGQVCETTPGSVSGEEIAFLRRHRPRLATPVRLTVNTAGAPTFLVDGTPYTVGVGGATTAQSVPELAPHVCDPSRAMTRVFPDSNLGDDPAIVCAFADPWAGGAEAFAARWEGGVLASTSGEVRFESGRVILESRRPLCEGGVLGADGIADVLSSADPRLADAPERAFVDDAGLPRGDQISITSNTIPDLSGEEKVRCDRYVARDGLGRRLPLTFAIERASEHELSLGALIARPDLSAVEREHERVFSCFPRVITYDVRARGVYVVTGARTGRLHRVVEQTGSGSARCTIDAARSPLLQSRAVPGRPFDSYYLGITIRGAVPAPVANVDLTISLGQLPSAIALGADTAGPTPTVVTWGPDERLYVSDGGIFGVAQIIVYTKTDGSLLRVQRRFQ